jgi:hypothetical protein
VARRRESGRIVMERAHTTLPRAASLPPPVDGEGKHAANSSDSNNFECAKSRWGERFAASLPRPVDGGAHRALSLALAKPIGEVRWGWAVGGPSICVNNSTKQHPHLGAPKDLAATHLSPRRAVLPHRGGGKQAATLPIRSDARILGHAQRCAEVAASPSSAFRAPRYAPLLQSPPSGRRQEHAS